MPRARWAAPFALPVIVALATACAASPGATDSSAPAAPVPGTPPASPAPTVSPTAPAGPATTVPPAASPATPVVTTAPVTGAGDAGAPGSCASYAASHTFAEFTSATAAPDGSLTVSAHPATMVCGGEDDLHYDIGTATEVVQLQPGGTIQVLGSYGSPPLRALSPAQFPAYLASDFGTRIFLVTGPLSDATAIQEQYHP